MSSVRPLKDFISDVFTDAAGKILRHFEESSGQYEEELRRQSRLLEIISDPQTRPQTILLPQYFLRNQERNSSVKLEDAEPPQIKGQQEELCSSQDVEQLDLKQEADILMVTPTYEEDEDLNCQHLLTQSLDATDDQNEDGNQHEEATSTTDGETNSWKKDQKRRSCVKSMDVLHESEVLPQYFLRNQEMNSSVKLEDAEPPQIKGQQEELCSSQDVEQLDLKQEADILMVTPTHEEDLNCQHLLTQSLDVTDDQNGDGQQKKAQIRNDHRTKSVNCCERCGKSFTTASLLRRHMRIHTGEKPFTCTECGRGFSQANILTNHMRTHTREKPFSCRACGRSFSQASSLTTHMRIHTGEKPFSCQQCGRSFTCSGSLTDHTRIHTGEKSFSCKACGRKFACERNLTKHMRIHTGEKPFSCKECGRSFSRTDYLSVHMLTHTGEKPFSCKECARSFTRANSLTVHMRIHTGEKPFSCDKCGRRFSRADYLNVHTRTHTGEKPFYCNECGRSFASAKNLTVHMRIHTGETIFL